MDLVGGVEAWKSSPQGHAWDCGDWRVPAVGGASGHYVLWFSWMIAPAKALRTALSGPQMQCMESFPGGVLPQLPLHLPSGD